MKKIFLLLTVFSMVFTSCNPLEDIYEELDANATVISGEAVFTLTDADYTDLGLSFGNFSSLDDAKTKLPSFLSKKFPVWGKESLAAVTFKLYNPKRTEKSLKIYEVTPADYVAGGHTYGNFDSYSDISDFLDSKYPAAPDRMLVNLTYEYYAGTTKTLENGFIIVNGKWEMATGITDAEYTAMGEARAQFDSETEALQKIPVYAGTKFQYENKKAGDIEGIMYKLYVTDTQDVDEDGRTDDKTVYSFVTYVIFDGVNWSNYDNIINDTLLLRPAVKAALKLAPLLIISCVFRPDANTVLDILDWCALQLVASTPFPPKSTPLDIHVRSGSSLARSITISDSASMSSLFSTGDDDNLAPTLYGNSTISLSEHVTLDKLVNMLADHILLLMDTAYTMRHREVFPRERGLDPVDFRRVLRSIFRRRHDVS